MNNQTEWRGSDNGFGLLNESDISILLRYVSIASSKFGNNIALLEIGVCCGYTARGIGRFCNSKGIKLQYYGIDGECGKPHDGTIPTNGRFILGQSEYVFDQVPEPLHVVFVDGCHCCNHVMLDFLHYSPKVVVGGYMLFHDTNPSNDWQGIHKDHYQGHGPQTASFHIATQEALNKLGLSRGLRSDWIKREESHTGNMLGMTVFEKVKQ